ncbi:hypothetical protein AAG906_038937 [Vitis piasezkii]
MSISSEGNGYLQVSLFSHMRKLADYIGLPCRIARGCKYCVANHRSSCLYVVPLEESQDCSWAPLDELWCALSTSQALIYLMLLMSYFFLNEEERKYMQAH